MSRRITVDPEWERRKEYLIRSLFQDPPPLSPNQEQEEEEESFDSARLVSNIPLSPVAEQLSNPYSPLPSLIIEVEPHRQYLEQSDEFFEQLRKRVLKVYRQLFNKDKSYVSSSDSSDGVDLDAAGTAEEEYGRNSFGISDDDLQYNAGVPTAEKNQTGSLKRAHILEKESITSEAKKSKIVDDENNSNPVYLRISTSEESNKDLRDSLSSRTPTELIGTAGSRITSDDVESEAHTTNSSQKFIQMMIQADVHIDFTDDRSMVPSPSATYVIVIDENAAAETDAAVEIDMTVERESLERHELLDASKATESNGGSAIPENNGALSPNQEQEEEEESFDSARLVSNVPLSPVAEQLSNPYSSHPSLNNEVEPHCQYQEHSDEFCEQLRKRVLKVHRQLFNKDKSYVSSTDSSDGVDLDAAGTAEKEYGRNSFGITDDDLQYNAGVPTAEKNQTGSLKRAHILEKESITSEAKKSKIVDDENNSNPVCIRISTSKESNKDLRDSLSSGTPTELIGTAGSRITSGDVESEAHTTNSSQKFIQMMIQADVHIDFTDDRSMVPSPSATYVIGIDENAAAETDAAVEIDMAVERESLERHEILDESKATESNGGSAILENNGVSVCYNAGQHSSSEAQLTQEIEVMRTPGIRTSHGSLQHEVQNSYCEDIAITDEPRILEPHTESSSSEDRVSMRSEINFDFLHRTSTPIERYDANGSCTETYSGTSSSESAGRRRVICEDAGVQTDDYGRANRDILNNLFTGVPLIFRLCSCMKHSCGH